MVLEIKVNSWLRHSPLRGSTSVWAYGFDSAESICPISDFVLDRNLSWIGICIGSEFVLYRNLYWIGICL